MNNKKMPHWVTDRYDFFISFVKNHTHQEVADRYSVTYRQVYFGLRRYGIKPKLSKHYGEVSDRDMMIAYLADKYSYTSIAKVFGISRQRVEQIKLKINGME